MGLQRVRHDWATLTFTFSHISISSYKFPSKDFFSWYIAGFLFFFFWSIVDLQYCISFMGTAKWFSYSLFHDSLLPDIEYSFLCYTVNPCCLSDRVVKIVISSTLSQFPFRLFLWPVGHMGFPGAASGKERACRCRRPERYGFDPWLGKIPWRKAWRPTPVFLPGKSPGTEEPGGLHSMGSHRVGHDWSDLTHTHMDHMKMCCLISKYLDTFHFFFF